ncbi:MAG: hypothetical protein K2I73_04135, partial [Eubacterium sp.]|nr:hypothetical protein [Eubacterium sp.]
ILHNGRICSYSSIDDDAIENLNGYIAEYKKNSQFWREYGFDYYEETTVANYNNNSVACPICSGSGVVQDVIGTDANGMPMYGMVGCGGCGGSGYIYR